MTDSPIIMQALDAQMRHAAQRQGVLSQNIANIDTPGYKAKDVKKLDFGAMMSAEANRLQLRATSPKHLEAVGAQGSGPYRADKVRKPFEETPVGNSVTLEDEMAKVSETGQQFQTASSLMKKYTAMMHSAAGSR